MENISEANIKSHKKRNRKLFVLYKFLANDLLFYYTISFLFLSNVKGLSTAQIVFAESFYPIFKLIFQIPSTIAIQKFGKKKSLLFANLCVGIYLFLILILNTTLELILANVFCAIGFVIKGIAESNFLFDSLENTENKKENFSKLEGKASAGFFFIDAITALATVFLFLINPYIPMILSCVCMIFAILIVCFFYEIPIEKKQEVKKQKFSKQLKSQISDTLTGFKYILKSTRLRALIICTASISMITSGLLNYFSSSYSALIVGICSFILMLFLIKYMSTRVGLKPEEYSEKDICLTK